MNFRSCKQIAILAPERSGAGRDRFIFLMAVVVLISMPR
jgi:hypothetical protein